MYKFAIKKADPSGTTLKDTIFVPGVFVVNIVLWTIMIVSIMGAYKKHRLRKIEHDYETVAGIIIDYMMMAKWNLKRPVFRTLLIIQNPYVKSGSIGMAFA